MKNLTKMVLLSLLLTSNALASERETLYRCHSFQVNEEGLLTEEFNQAIRITEVLVNDWGPHRQNKGFYLESSNMGQGPVDVEFKKDPNTDDVSQFSNKEKQVTLVLTSSKAGNIQNNQKSKYRGKVGIFAMLYEPLTDRNLICYDLRQK